MQLKEAIIKVPEGILRAMVKSARQVIFGRVFSHMMKIEKRENDKEVMEVFYSKEMAYVKRNMKWYTGKIDFNDKGFMYTWDVPRELMHIDGYPDITKDSVTLQLEIFFEDVKTIEGTYYIDRESGASTIRVIIPEFFRVLGKNKEGETVYSMDVVTVEKLMKDVPATIQHELMHIVQDLHITPKVTSKGKSDPFPVNYTSDDFDSPEGMRKYLSSEVEFSPYLLSELKKFQSRYINDNPTKEELYNRMMTFVGAGKKDTSIFINPSVYFDTLKGAKPKNYKIAVKAFYKKVMGEFNG